MYELSAEFGNLARPSPLGSRRLESQIQQTDYRQRKQVGISNVEKVALSLTQGWASGY